jgi:hypothetical protein
VMDHRWQRIFFFFKFCNMFLFRGKTKSHFSFLCFLCCLSYETFCLLYFHSLQWKKLGK